MKLLIIDDNAAVRTTLKMVLSGIFTDIMSVADPQLLPVLLRNDDVDAVLLDMNFDTSRLDGREGLLWLSKIKESPSSPAVVLITAFGDVPLAVEAMKNGADDFITKPWDNDQLIAKLLAAVRRNRISRRREDVLARASGFMEKENARLRLKLDDVKYEHVREVVADCGGNLTAAAKSLGINRQTLYNILKGKQG